MMAWLGADVLKVERMKTGDNTRIQLRDIPNVDALYFTMVNSNKRSLEIDTKTPEGKAILEELIRRSDVMVENMAPGALDRQGFTWEHIHELNPRLIFGVVKGFPDGSPFTDVKSYENVAQCAGGNASTTGFWDGPPTVSGAALGDSNTGMHLAIGILTALIGREKTGKGQKVAVSMQDAVLNLCRVKLRDQERLEHVGYLEEYPQYPNGKFGDAVPRGGNAGGGVVEVQQERRGSYLTVGSPIKFSGFTPEITGAPLLGEHTDEVLTELGYSREQIAKLHGKNVVGSSGSSRGHRDIRRSA